MEISGIRFYFLFMSQQLTWISDDSYNRVIGVLGGNLGICGSYDVTLKGNQEATGSFKDLHKTENYILTSHCDI